MKASELRSNTVYCDHNGDLLLVTNVFKLFLGCNTNLFVLATFETENLYRDVTLSQDTEVPVVEVGAF